MLVAIDAAGRLVVPKAVREELGVTGATQLEINAADGRAELTVPTREMRVDTSRGFPVFATDRDVPALTTDAVRGAVERSRR